MKAILHTLNASLFLHILFQCKKLNTTLPDRVASHFGSNGIGEAFITRGAFLLAYAGIATATYLFMLLLSRNFKHIHANFISMPNGDIWLAPHRREETNHIFEILMLWFSLGLLTLLTALLNLMANANQLSTPRLDTPIMITVIIIYMAFVAGWTFFIYRRFNLPG